MKLLIGYDGSPMADTSLDDLKSAGLPEETEVVVMSVAEVWLSPENVQKNGDQTKNALRRPRRTISARQCFGGGCCLRTLFG